MSIDTLTIEKDMYYHKYDIKVTLQKKMKMSHHIHFVFLKTSHDTLNFEMSNEIPQTHTHTPAVGRFSPCH